MTELADTRLEASATMRFRSARRSIAAAYVGHGLGLLLGGLGVTAIVQLLPAELHWLSVALVVLMLGTMVIGPAWSYAFTKYTVSADAVIEETGWLDRRVKTLRWNRVQAIDRDTDWQLRLFGLASLTIAQGGQEATQIEVRGIRAATIERVLELARAGGATTTAPTVADRPGAGSAAAEAQPDESTQLYRASVADLAIMSVMFGTAILAAPALAFGGWEIAEQFGVQDGLRDVAGRFDPVAIVVVAAVATVLFSIVKTVLTYYRFTVRRIGSDLHISHGLLVTQQRTFREASIQGVVVQRNLLEQCTGRARLWLLTLDSDDDLGKNLVLPSLPLSVVERIARESFPTRVPIAGRLLARRPPIVTSFITTVMAVGVGGGTYAWLALQLEWAPLLAGGAALVSLAILAAIFRVLLARLDADADSELVLLRRTYLTESLRSVDMAAVRRVSARRMPRWLAPNEQRLLPSAAIYAGKRVMLRALRADATAIERIRTVCIARAPEVAAATLAQHRG